MRRRHTFAHRLSPHAGTTESLLAKRFGHTLEPAFGFEEQVTVWNRRGPGRLTLRGFEPDLYRIKPEWVSLPADGKRSFQGLKTFFEGKHWRVRLDIARPLSLDLGCVCAGEPRHKRKQALPFSLSRAIIQLHRQKGGGHPETQSLSLIEPWTPSTHPRRKRGAARATTPTMYHLGRCLVG